MNDRFSFDVVVVGAGPAGLGAACAAAESGARVGSWMRRHGLGDRFGADISLDPWFRKLSAG